MVKQCHTTAGIRDVIGYGYRILMSYKCSDMQHYIVTEYKIRGMRDQCHVTTAGLRDINWTHERGYMTLMDKKTELREGGAELCDVISIHHHGYVKLT